MTKERFTGEILALKDTLYGVSRTYLRSCEDCADAVQEAILKAWAHLPTLRREEYFRTWVVRILINECKRTLKRQRRLVLVAQYPETAAEPGEDGGLYEAVMALPEKYRLPLVLHYCEGCSVAEVGHALRLPKGTVVSRLSRGRELLKRDYFTGEARLDEG